MLSRLIKDSMLAKNVFEGESKKGGMGIKGRGRGPQKVNKLLVLWFLIACPSSRTTRKNSFLNSSPRILSYSSPHSSSFSFLPAICFRALSEGNALTTSL